MAKNNSMIPLIEQRRRDDIASGAYQKAANSFGTANYGTNIGSAASVQNNGINSNAVNSNLGTSRTINTSGIDSGNSAVRGSFLKYGLDNDKIGWDDNTKSVLYDGQAVLNPTNIVDGKSYATDKDIYNAVSKAYENMGDPLVTATDYAAQTGVSNLVQWNGNTLSVGGVTVNPVTITADGKAIVRTSDIDKALGQWKTNTGYKSNADVVSEWQNKYGDRIDQHLNDKILNRKEWSYDPNTDPAYQAYKAQYQREGNRAMQDAIASMSGNTGGMANSAAMTAGAQQANYYNQQLTDKIPELMNDSYNRYTNDYNMNMQALDALIGVGDNSYNKNYTAARDTINDLNNAYDKNYNRNMTEREWLDNHAINQQNMRLNEYALQKEAENSKYYDKNAFENSEKLKYDNILTQTNINANNLANEQTAFNNAYERARKRNGYTDADAQVVGVSADADPYQADYDYARKMGIINNDVSLDEWNRIGKTKLDAETAANKALNDYQTDNQIRANQANYDTQSGAVSQKQFEEYKAAAKNQQNVNGNAVASEYIDSLAISNNQKSVMKQQLGIADVRGSGLSAAGEMMYKQLSSQAATESITKEQIIKIVGSSNSLKTSDKKLILESFGITDDDIK